MNVSSVSLGAGMLAFFALGAVLSAAYDLLCIWRALFRSAKRTVWLQDFLFMWLAGYASFLLCLGVCFGELRFYLFFCELFGWVLWHETVGHITVPAFRRLFRFLYRRLFLPVHVRFSVRTVQIGTILGKFTESARKWLGNRKKVLKPCRTLVYNYHTNERKQPRLRKEGRRRA